MRKYDNYKKTISKRSTNKKIFHNFYRKSLQDNLIDKNEYESLCNNFTEYLDETKNYSFS